MKNFRLKKRIKKYEPQFAWLKVLQAAVFSFFAIGIQQYSQKQLQLYKINGIMITVIK